MKINLKSCLVAYALMLSTSTAHALNPSFINFNGNDIIYDAHSDRIYATANGSNGLPIGNAISTINPYLQTVERSVFIGSDPGQMAITDNGHYIYAALNGSGAMGKYDVFTNTRVGQFSLGSSQYTGALRAEDLATVPGTENSVAISLRNTCCSPRHEGVALFVDGVRAANSTPGHTGSNRIEFGSNPNTLYGYNNETTEFGFRKMTVNSSGITTTNVNSGVLSGFGLDFEVSGDIGYATNGTAFNPATGEVLGTYGAAGVLEADPSKGLMYIMSGSMLDVFSLDTFVLLNSVNLSTFSGTATDMIKYGDHGLAILSNAGRVYFVDTQAIPLPAASFLYTGAIGLLGFFARRNRT